MPVMNLMKKMMKKEKKMMMMHLQLSVGVPFHELDPLLRLHHRFAGEVSMLHWRRMEYCARSSHLHQQSIGELVPVGRHLLIEPRDGDLPAHDTPIPQAIHQQNICRKLG